MPKGIPIRLYHATAAGALPPAGSLTEGELALDALSQPARLWTQVPVTRDPSGRIDLLSDGAPTLPLQIANGGTGATTEAGAVTNLGGPWWPIVSATAPSPATDRMLWYDTTSLQMFIRYNDGATSQWVQVAGGGAGSNFLPISNPAFTGNLSGPNAAFSGTVTLGGDATLPLQAVTLQQLNSRLGNYLPINNPNFTGAMTGTMSGTQFFELSSQLRTTYDWNGAVLALQLLQANSTANPVVPNAILFAGTANGNWATMDTITNTGTGPFASTTFYMNGNNVGGFLQEATLSLQNTGNITSTTQNAELVENGCTLRTNGRGGLNLATTGGGMPFTPHRSPIRFWIDGGIVMRMWWDTAASAFNFDSPALAFISGFNGWWKEASGLDIEVGGSWKWFHYPVGYSQWWTLRASDRLAFNASGGIAGYGVTDLSDIRTKANIEPDRHGLDCIRKLNPIDFERAQVPDTPRRRELGFSAQEVMEVLPEAAMSLGPADTPTPEALSHSKVPVARGLDNVLGVLPTALIALCVNAIKELDARLTDVERR